MPITAYTTYDDVRAVLGVSSKDLADATLALHWYSDALDEALDEVSPNLAQAFADASAATTPSAEQVRLIRSVRTFAATVVAKTATTAVRMFAPQHITDGKAAMSRFTDPIKELVKDIDAKYLDAREKVVAALAGTTPAVTVARQWFSAVSPADDPVTG